MLLNSITWVFWMLAVLAVSASIFAITVKKFNQAIIGISILLVAVGALLIELEFYLAAAIYAISCGGFVIILNRIGHANLPVTSEPKQLSFHPRAFLRLITAMLAFTVCLYLISHTDVWQYRLTAGESSITKLFHGFSSDHLVFVIVLISFLLVMVPVIWANFKRKQT